MLLGMMTETMWEPPGCGCDAVQEVRPSGLERLVLSQWCDGFLGFF